LAAFAQFGSDLDPKTKAQLDRGSRIVELFKQPALKPFSMEVEVGIVWAMQNDFFDDIPLDQITRAKLSLQDHLQGRGSSVLESIKKKKELTDDIATALRKTVEEWKQTWSND